MKKRLLKPPLKDGEILFLPHPEGLIGNLSDEKRIGSGHQPYFFNPGISLKFIIMEGLPKGKKDIVFLDTDRVNLQAKIPVSEAGTQTYMFINTDKPLYDLKTPAEKEIIDFFDTIEKRLSVYLKNKEEDTNTKIYPLHSFREIFKENAVKRTLLKEVLAESILQFYKLRCRYHFLSDLLKGGEYEEFYLRIYKDQAAFRNIFNNAIDEYKTVFRFRYKNFPFPKLLEDELPFWIIRDGIRMRCFMKDLRQTDLKRLTLFPRAAALTLFLRLYMFDLFIHGIGGGNYEWVQDRIIERFFGRQPPEYAVISGTFLFRGMKERDLPFFLFPPAMIRERANMLLRQAVSCPTCL